MNPKYIKCIKYCINHRIVFSSPFYKKKKQPITKLKNFDKYISEEEIQEYRKKIMRHINPNIVS